MDVMKTYPLKIEGEAFEAFRIQFDQMLEQIFLQMQEKNVESASITAKFDITLAELDIDDPDTGTACNVKCPIIKHKMSGAMQVKSEASGKFGSLDYQLQWSKARCCFVMQPVRQSQRSMFDDEYEYDNDDFSKEEGTEDNS